MAKNSTAPSGFGVFKKAGEDRTVVAETVEDAVRYRFDGWEEVAPAAPENQPDAGADASV